MIAQGTVMSTASEYQIKCTNIVPFIFNFFNLNKFLDIKESGKCHFFHFHYFKAKGKKKHFSDLEANLKSCQWDIF